MGGVGFSLAVRNFTGRSAPPWRPSLGAARVWTSQGPEATLRVGRARGLWLDPRGRDPLLLPPPGLEARSSLAPDAGAGRTAVPSRCGLRCSLLASSTPEAHAWVRSQPPPPLPFPSAGAAGDGARGGGIPLREFGVSPPCADPGSVRRCCRDNHFRAAQPEPPGSSWRRLRRGSQGDWKGGDLQTPLSGGGSDGGGGSGVHLLAHRSACRRAGEKEGESFPQKINNNNRLENKQRRARGSARKCVHGCACACVCARDRQRAAPAAKPKIIRCARERPSPSPRPRRHRRRRRRGHACSPGFQRPRRARDPAPPAGSSPRGDKG
jgi:hypothetical protein